MNRRELLTATGALAVAAGAASGARAAPLTAVRGEALHVQEGVAPAMPHDISDHDFAHSLDGLAAEAEARGEHKSAHVMRVFAESDVLRAMFFLKVMGGAYAYVQEGRLPGVAFRGLPFEDDAPPATIVNPQVERLRIAGGDLDVALEHAHERSKHEDEKLRALASHHDFIFTRGDAQKDPRQADGLQKRIRGDMRIVAGRGVGGAPLSTGMLADALNAVDGANALLMPAALVARMEDKSLIHTRVDRVGRHRRFYGDVQVLAPSEAKGVRPALAFDEDCFGGGLGASVYALSIGDTGVVMLQNGPIDAHDLGFIDVEEQARREGWPRPISAIDIYRTRVEWLTSPAVLSGRAASRLWSVADAPIIVT